MNRKLVINFLEKLKSSNNIPVDLFENSNEYTPGELLDFLVELEKTKVADFRNGIIRVTSEKQKIREFKARNISFTKSLGTGAVKFSASKIGEDLFLLLDYIHYIVLPYLFLNYLIQYHIYLIIYYFHLIQLKYSLYLFLIFQ